MRKLFEKLKFGARVLLSRGKGEAEMIDVAGRTVTIRHAGDGPPLVYLHSTLGESMMWLPFLNRWSSSHHVYAPLHPGFGDPTAAKGTTAAGSTGFDQIDSIEDMAFHYVELFDALGFDEIYLGGVSLGGWIAAEFAARWPERVKKLWLSGAPGFWLDDQPLPDLFRYLQDREAMRRLLFHDPAGPMATMILSDSADEKTLMTAYQSMTVLARMVWERPYSPRLGPRLRRVQCPVLLLWGENDRLVPKAYGEAYRQWLPHAEWATIADCGHLPMFEKENEFVERVRKFCTD